MLTFIHNTGIRLKYSDNDYPNSKVMWLIDDVLGRYTTMCEILERNQPDSYPSGNISQNQATNEPLERRIRGTISWQRTANRMKRWAITFHADRFSTVSSDWVPFPFTKDVFQWAQFSNLTAPGLLLLILWSYSQVELPYARDTCTEYTLSSLSKHIPVRDL